MRLSKSMISICSRKVLKQNFSCNVMNADSLGFNSVYVIRSLSQSFVVHS